MSVLLTVKLLQLSKLEELVITELFTGGGVLSGREHEQFMDTL